MNLYVYYTVVEADAAPTAAAVRAMQSSLGLPAAATRLLRRPESRDARQTWMEIYEGVPAGFGERLAAAVAAHGLDRRTGARHVERFVAVD